MTGILGHLWSPLASTPLLWLMVTLCAYGLGRGAQKACGGAAAANPVMIAITLVAMFLLSTGTSYRTYFDGAQFIHFLLGPTTVAMAVPLVRNSAYVRRNLRGIGVALVAGSLTSIVSGVMIVSLCGGSADVALSMAPKGVTTPIAMAVSGQIGGVPALTAALAILGGIVAAVSGQRLLRRLDIEDWRVHGLAAGVAGSGVAAAQVAARNELGAAFAALGIGLNGLLTALLAPLLAGLFHR